MMWYTHFVRKGSIDEKWCRDTGIIAAILSLFVEKGGATLVFISITILVLALVYPRALWPLGFLWKVIADVLAAIVPRVFFGVVFIFIILPIGLIRRAFGRDPLMLHSERYASAFHTRDHTFSKSDLMTPF